MSPVLFSSISTIAFILYHMLDVVTLMLALCASFLHSVGFFFSLPHNLLCEIAAF